MIEAIFSNGHRDEYKGTRPVKAAWAIIRKSDNATLGSGHSLDAAKAAKTAQGNTRYHISEALGRRPAGLSDRPSNKFASRSAYFAKLARDMGFGSWKAAYAAYQMDAAAACENMIIEIIDL